MTYGLILAAGFGSRLGHDMPKAMIEWKGRRIIDHQLANLQKAGIDDVWVVLGFKADEVRGHIEADWPRVRFVENPMYMDTNTAKSMLIGLQDMPPGDVIALNGDVVFDHAILTQLLEHPGKTCLAVDPRICGDEEIKYRIRDGRLQALSKQVHGDGEAVGINQFAAADRDLLQGALQYVEMQAYFERAVEHILPFTSNPVECLEIGDLRAMEIDFPEDLEAAHELFS